jgi:glycosyltransferase involved in cell wall biosynthesis
MRVALIAPPWIPVPPPAYGGTEAVIDTLARGLEAAGHEVLLATTGDSTCPVERTWVYERAKTDEMGDIAVELTHLLHAYDAAVSADIVHDHTVAGPVLGSLRSSIPPVVTTNHGRFTDDVRALYRSLGDRVPIVALSHHHASTAGDVAVARVIHHGLDEDRYPVGPGGDHLAFVGRMSPTKGVRQAVEIAERAGTPLVIAAKMRTTAEHEYFDTEIKPLLGGNVHYVGELGLAAKLELLGSALALLNPIQWDEPFGLCMVEALACGTPVIATRRGAAPEIVDHGITGFLCTGTEEAVAAIAWAASLDRLACRAAVTARFSARRMVADHVALYRDVLAGQVRPAA